MSFSNKPNVFSHITHNTKLSCINSSLVAVREQRKSISMIIPRLKQEECLSPIPYVSFCVLESGSTDATSGLSDGCRSGRTAAQAIVFCLILKHPFGDALIFNLHRSGNRRISLNSNQFSGLEFN